jgi:hypothetical protein
VKVKCLNVWVVLLAAWSFFSTWHKANSYGVSGKFTCGLNSRVGLSGLDFLLGAGGFDTKELLFSACLRTACLL